MNQITARDLMKRTALTVRPSMTLSDLERFLVEHKITGAPVVDNLGKLVGVVSRSDIIKHLVVETSIAGYLVDYQSDAGLVGALSPDEETSQETSLAVDSLQRKTVADAMIHDVICVGPDASLSEVAGQMHSHHIHRVVVTEGDIPIGIVTSIDLIERIADGTVS